MNLNAEMPRVVRISDEFYGGASVTRTNPSYSQALVTMQIVCDFVSPISTLQQIHKLSNNPIEVQFQLKAIGLGVSQYIITVYSRLSEDSHWEIEDSFTSSLSIENQQPSVMSSTSRTISMDSTDSIWKEQIVFPSSVPFSGHLFISVGSGHLPTINSFSASLIDQYDIQQHSTEDLLSQLVPWPSLSLSIGDVPPKKGSPEGSLIQAASKSFDLATLHLIRRTNQKYGLQTAVDLNNDNNNNEGDDVGDGNARHYPSLDALGLYFLNVSRLILGGDVVQQRIPDSIAAQWAAALDSGLNSIVSSSSSPVPCDLLALSFAAMGRDWIPSQQQQPPQLQPLDFNSMVNRLEECSTFGKSLIVISLLRPDPISIASQYYTTVTLINQMLLSQVRVQGQTAYIPLPNSSTVDVSGTIAAVEALVLSRSTSPFVPQLVNFIVQQSTLADQFKWRWTNQQLAFSCLSLATYDQMTLSVNQEVPNLEVSCELSPSKNSGIKLLEGSVKSLSSPLIVSTAFETIPGWCSNDQKKVANLSSCSVASEESLVFEVYGTGSVDIVVSMDFVPATVNSQQIYQGFSIQKIIQTLDPKTGLYSNVIPHQTVLSRGDQLKITIQITTADDLFGVIVQDLLSGAIEAFDTNIYPFADPSSSSFSNNIPLLRTPVKSLGWWWSWFSGFFSDPQFAYNSVQWEAAYLPAGTQELSYMAIVVGRGSFIVPATKAWVSSEPAVMGLSVPFFIVISAARESDSMIVSQDDRSLCLSASVDQPTFEFINGKSGGSDESSQSDYFFLILILAVVFGLLSVLFVVIVASVIVRQVRKKRQKNVVDW